MSRMFCTKIKLLAQKTVFEVFLSKNVLSAQIYVKLRNSQI